MTEFVELEDKFGPVKATAQLVGDVKSFQGFVVDLPEGVDVSAYTTVLVWCASLEEFIIAAGHR